MTDKTKSILLITPDDGIADLVGTALQTSTGLQVETQASTLAKINGHAVKMMSDHDVILFHTSPNNMAEITAIEAMTANRRPGTTLIALVDGNVSLSQVRALTHAGVDEVLPLPAEGEELDRRVLKLARAAAAKPAEAVSRGRIIAVTQARGGIGSTTVAVNLADQLVGGRGWGARKQGRKVALVDLDLQFGTVGSFLDLPEQDSLLQLALDGVVPDENFLDQAMVKGPNGISVMPAPSKFAPLDSLRPDQVAAILDTLRQSHDFVVVDLPRAIVNWIEPVIQRADELLVVTDMSVPAIRHCRRLIDFFTQDNPALTVDIVVNHENRPLLQSRVHREAAKALERKLDLWLPHDARAATNSADRGQPLSLAAPRSPLGKAMGRLAQSVVNRHQETARRQGNSKE
ncbi:AAA family ATPase [Defluviimonas sp. WL0024]|uniref:AAA family ATPase n=2 Tax=Albidovulum TaxID=205889 RepID=A0ABT3J455_9RHOB|nr:MULTISPECIES: AAA family ATPase [Defluviimonas]MCU9847842.1 AAA family ATPase [Defluviimonas sp. WL0024]MCW3782445.1 AAA family ATPase [Defluviimonas salinarum]